MSNKIERWSCDLCGREFPAYQQVEGDITVRNGGESRLYVNVCHSCIVKFDRLLDEEFPKNSFIPPRQPASDAVINQSL